MADEEFPSTGRIRRRGQFGNTGPGPAASSTIGGAAAGPPEPAMDRWLQKQLQRLYDELVDEPLSPELRDLIDQIGRRVGNS